MRLLQSTPSSRYFVGIFIIGAALFMTFSAVLYRQHEKAHTVNQWAIHYYEVLRVTRSTLIDLLNAETSVRGYLLTGRKDFLDPYEDAIPRLEIAATTLKEMVKDDPYLSEKIDTLVKKIDPFKQMLRMQVELVRSKGKNAVTPETLNLQKVNMDHLRSSIETFVEESLSLLNTRLRQARLEQKDYIITLVSGTMLAIGGMLLSILIILSLAARNRKAEQSIRESEERFLTVMNGINDGLFDFDVVHKTIYYSPAYKAMLGYSDEEHPNTLEAFKALVHPEDYDRMMEVSRQYREHEIPVYRNIFRLRHKDGSWRWILSRGIGMWDASNRMTRLIGTHTDITEQKNREEELEQLNSDLESFTYITSHDLRSPLVNLKGFAGEMAHALEQLAPVIEKIEPALPENDRKTIEASFKQDIPEALNFIQKSVEKMDSLTNAVLELSRIGKHEYRFETIDTNALVKRCLDALAYEISQQDIEVICHPLPTIVTDAMALEQVFSNLLDNAVKYLEKGRRGRIEISAITSSKDPIFSIQDNGRGIAEKDRQKIFEIFRRARNTSDVRGLGMGMAYVKATIRKLGGAIWFESEVGKGTTFYFRLPTRYSHKEAV